jgi:hypothetical protein
MSAYTNIPIAFLAPDPRRDHWIVTEPIIWEIGKLGSGLTYTVPVDFRFDCSVPRWVPGWAINPYDRRFMKASALHDHMLIAGWDRPTAGAVFNDALKADGVGRLKRFAMFTAVVWFKWD